MTASILLRKNKYAIGILNSLGRFCKLNLYKDRVLSQLPACPERGVQSRSIAAPVLSPAYHIEPEDRAHLFPAFIALSTFAAVASSSGDAPRTTDIKDSYSGFSSRIRGALRFS